MGRFATLFLSLALLTSAALGGTTAPKGRPPKPTALVAPVSPAKVPPVLVCAATCPAASDQQKSPDPAALKKAQVELELTLTYAEEAAKFGHWDKAEKLYEDALKSGAADDQQQKEIRQKLDKARAVTDSSSWQWGALFPPLRWYRATVWPPAAWILIALLGLFAAASVPARIEYTKGRGLFSWIGDGLKAAFMPPFRGRAHIVDPVKLTKDAEVDLFVQALQHAASVEVNNRWARTRSRVQAGPVALLTIPSVLANTAVSGLPDIKGINLGKIFNFVFVIVRYFGWRVETRLSFRPALASEHEHPASPAMMKAYASVRWAWFVKETIVVECDVWDQYDVSSIAFALAARLGGIQFDRT